MRATPGTFHGDHAVVIGASISGLLAARVLSEHFGRVTVLDRDTLPSGVDNRKSVPQGRHGHGLLASGYRGLKRLFPDLERELVDAGAVPGDVIGNVRWFQHGYYKAQFPSGLGGLLLSRPLLETTMRRQVSRLPNVAIQDGIHVLGPIVENGRVEGVRLHRPPMVETVGSDLVVDASGRSSRSPEWLEQAGYEPPAVDEVKVDLGYTTRLYRRRPGDMGSDMGAVVAPRPGRSKRAGFMLAQEGDRWIVSLSGWLGDHAPTDPEGYLEYARSLSRPDIYDVIKVAAPLTDAVKYVFPSNLRRRYERLKRFPSRYVVMGDAICSFNPLYGQGMSVATMEAQALAECLGQALASSVDELWRPFFKLAGRVIESPWTIAAGSDFAFPGVTGKRPAGNGVINWYLNYVHQAASMDRHVCRAFFDVANLLRPAPTLFSPGVVARVARACLFPGRSKEPTPSERHRLAESA